MWLGWPSIRNGRFRGVSFGNRKLPSMLTAALTRGSRSMAGIVLKPPAECPTTAMWSGSMGAPRFQAGRGWTSRSWHGRSPGHPRAALARRSTLFRLSNVVGRLEKRGSVRRHLGLSDGRSPFGLGRDRPQGVAGAAGAVGVEEVPPPSRQVSETMTGV